MISEKLRGGRKASYKELFYRLGAPNCNGLLLVDVNRMRWYKEIMLNFVLDILSGNAKAVSPPFLFLAAKKHQGIKVT